MSNVHPSASAQESAGAATPASTAAGSRTDASVPPGLTPTDPGFRRALVAVLFAGIASFQALYATQALLPVLTDDLGISPATAALTVSATTGGLACAIIPMSVLSERFGRRPMILIGAVLATVLGLTLALAPGAAALIGMRLVQGVIIAGVPAVAMTYVSEEVHPQHVPRIMGLYVAGTTVGGLLGRIIPSVVLEFGGWRVATVVSSVVAFSFALATVWLLPRQRRFTPKTLTLGGEFRAIVGHLRNPRLLGLYALAFLSMGGFVSLYNYVGFRLGDTFGLSAGVAGMVFLLYLTGTWSSARAGSYAQRIGRREAMLAAIVTAIAGLALAATPWLATLLLGIALFTGGFFVAHSLASSSVGLIATSDRAEASSMYLFSYYLGSSAVGWFSGHVLDWGSWGVLVGWLIGLYVLAGVAAVVGTSGIRAIRSRKTA
ncbi:MFS transporter [Corynebacterium hansenii]|uniref:MFS transporter n=1 Tax=Corynebacterium hansenii TaxID=394964 RepID=A0ABV7ZQM9_9CORY|nr:MFS transporter [Corynebacterium hansenii]